MQESEIRALATHIAREQQASVDAAVARGIREYFKNGLPSGTYSSFQWDGTRIVGAGAGGFAELLAVARATASQTALGDGTPLRVDFNTVVYDPHAAITTGASWLFAVPGDGGIVRVEARVPLTLGSNAWGETDIAQLLSVGPATRTLAYLNGVAYNSGGIGGYLPLDGWHYQEMSAGDDFYVEVQQDSGNDLSINTADSVIMIWCTQA